MNEKIIARIKKEALENDVPIIEDEGLELVINILKENGVKSILEIGTAVGYSSIVFASIADDIEILTIEKDEDRYQIAQKNITEAHLQNRITSILADAREYKTDQMFDAIFLDGPKAHNQQLFDNYINNLKENGVMIIDDVYFHGLLDHPELVKTRRLRALTRKLLRFRENMLNNKDYIADYNEVGDGVLIVKRRENYE